MVELICFALLAYWVILLVRVILSFTSQMWRPPGYLGAGIRVVHDLTEPVLGLLRRYIPPVGGLDFSPLVVFLAIGLARDALQC